jgi:CDP-diacylglycerol--serine O-phosphatidyltransferase
VRQPHEEVREGRARTGRRRRRRLHGGRRRGFYLLPHLFTTGNLFFGFFSLVSSTTGKADLAALGIVIAGVFDALDGRVARLARTTSRFGFEYDSLADVVSFGVAPAMLAFHGGNLAELGRVGFVACFIFAVCAALRLARFNVTPSRYEGRFEGLPSPAAAGMVATTQWFVGFLREQGIAIDVPEFLVALGTVVLGLLMVSPIPYRSFKELDVRHSYWTLVTVVIVFAIIMAKPALTLFLLGLAYTTSGPGEWVWRWRTGQLLEPMAEAAVSENGGETTQGWNP